MSIDGYRSAIRSAVYGLWVGAGDYVWFTDAMWSAIDRYLPMAWNEGAAECGILPAEMTFAEKMLIRRTIVEQRRYVAGFAIFIEQHSKAAGGKRDTVYDRAEVWVQRYNELRERAQSEVCADFKAIWEYGDTIKHCRDCSRVVGRVYRVSTWDRYGWIPGSRELACGGWRCDCRRRQTTEPVTRGRPPRVRGK